MKAKVLVVVLGLTLALTLMFAMAAPALAVVSVDIDIKPGSDCNSINTNSNSIIAVAILGSASFDVTDVDASTLAFGPDGATPVHNHFNIEDVNGDGYDDLVSHYRVQATGLTAGDTSATLTGMYNGTDFSGTDSVKVR
jgi:hypothetical protein